MTRPGLAGLEVEALALSRGLRPLFRDLSLRLAPGEAVMLAGANGAGKTSLLRAVAGLLRPDAGEIRFPGLEPDEARREALHLLGHHDGLKPQRRAGEEFAFWADWLGGAETLRTEAIDVFDLRPLLALDVRMLSAGQRRRLALARLLAAPRPLWLLDEPMAPLDARWRGELGRRMQAHLDGGGMILAAAHDPLPVATAVVEVGA